MNYSLLLKSLSLKKYALKIPKIKLLYAALVFMASFFGTPLCAQPTFRTFYKPIIFDSIRIRLSLQYLKDRHGLTQATPAIKPIMVVLHWTAIPSLEKTFDAFNSATLPEARRQIASASTLNVSSQYLIDRDGTIFQLMPDSIFARHVIGLNYCAIGVENVGSEKNPLTEAQLKANEDVIRYLATKYPIEYVIGHYEYTQFIGTPLWRESDPKYLTKKTDPGILFMKRIRENIKDLNLKGAPSK